uniref:Uncharacterized protein n=1 Tax=Glossina austeni TaxID=7395 RepID=A0A1A9VGG5_GLOAU
MAAWNAPINTLLPIISWFTSPNSQVHPNLVAVGFSKSPGSNSTTCTFINKLAVHFTIAEILCEIIKKFPLNSIYGDTSYATHFLYRNEPTDKWKEYFNYLDMSVAVFMRY